MKSLRDFDNNLQDYKDYLRDYFAGRAMQGLLANPEFTSNINNYGEAVPDALFTANALVAALYPEGEGLTQCATSGCENGTDAEFCETCLKDIAEYEASKDTCPECGHARHGKECLHDNSEGLCDPPINCPCTHESKPKRIRVVRASQESFWYAELINAEFDVLGEDDEDYTVSPPDGPSNYGVRKQDAEVIEYE
jgi:hypothetical protein